MKFVVSLPDDKQITVECERYHIDQGGNLVIIQNHWNMSKTTTVASGQWIAISPAEEKTDE